VSPRVGLTGTLKPPLTELIGMSDRKLTLFELHFDDGFQVGPKTIGLGGDEDEPEDEATASDSGLLGLGGDDGAETEDDEPEADDEPGADDEPEADDDGEEGSPVSLLLGLVALAFLAAVARRLLGDDEDLEIETPEQNVEEFEPEAED